MIIIINYLQKEKSSTGRGVNNIQLKAFSVKQLNYIEINFKVLLRHTIGGNYIAAGSQAENTADNKRSFVRLQSFN